VLQFQERYRGESPIAGTLLRKLEWCAAGTTTAAAGPRRAELGA
jgi:hypothetical protein